MSGPADTGPPPDGTGEKAPRQFPLAVLMERQPVTGHRWVTERWVAASVVAGDAVGVPGEPIVVRDDELERRLHPGLALELFPDDAPSYYNNLMAAQPSVFVICALDDEGGGPPQPSHVTVSYGEASAYMETDEPVFAVPMPPEVYVWVERYVLEHYVPEPPRKRKRVDWKHGERRDGR